MIEVMPLDDFVHGTITARRGVPVHVGKHTALGLERAGLVRVHQAAAPQKNKMDANPGDGPAGKTQAAGEAPPSSASPAAQASVQTTAKPSRRGARQAL